MSDRNELIGELILAMVLVVIVAAAFVCALGMMGVFDNAATTAPDQRCLYARTFDFGDGNGPVAAHCHMNPTGSFGGWVADTAYVAPTAYIGWKARVFGHASITDKALVVDSAVVYGFAQIEDHAVVSDNAQISGEARISGFARVEGTARVEGSAEIGGHTYLSIGQYS